MNKNKNKKEINFFFLFQTRDYIMSQLGSDDYVINNDFLVKPSEYIFKSFFLEKKN